VTDINAIRARLREAYCWSGDYEAALSDACNDVAALCDEVERLRAEAERDDLALTLANERGEGAGPSEGWEYADETWWGPGYAVTRFNRGGGWQLCAIGTDGSPTEAPIPNPSWHTARDGMKEGAAMLAADAAIKAGGPS
jgi:hypothetical protein